MKDRDLRYIQASLSSATLNWPKTVGYYGLASFQIAMTRRPCWLHRKMMQWFFGWTWKEAK